MSKWGGLGSVGQLAGTMPSRFLHVDGKKTIGFRWRIALLARTHRNLSSPDVGLPLIPIGPSYLFSNKSHGYYYGLCGRPEPRSSIKQIGSSGRSGEPQHLDTELGKSGRPASSRPITTFNCNALGNPATPGTTPFQAVASL